MRYGENAFQAMMRRVWGDELRGNIPYEQPDCEIPDGFTALNTPWEGEGPVEILWPNDEILPFDGTHKQYMINLRYVFADSELPFAWRYER